MISYINSTTLSGNAGLFMFYFKCEECIFMTYVDNFVHIFIKTPSCEVKNCPVLKGFRR